MPSVNISTKGWVVIPAELRRRYGLQPGQSVQIVDYGGVIAIVPALIDPIADSAGMLAGDTSLTDALLREKALEREHEG